MAVGVVGAEGTGQSRGVASSVGVASTQISMWTVSGVLTLGGTSCSRAVGVVRTGCRPDSCRVLRHGPGISCRHQAAVRIVGACCRGDSCRPLAAGEADQAGKQLHRRDQTVRTGDTESLQS